MTATLGKSAVLGENHTTTHNVSGNLAAISSSNQRRRRGAVTATSTPATVTPIELPLIVTMSNNSTPVYSGNVSTSSLCFPGNMNERSDQNKNPS